MESDCRLRRLLRRDARINPPPPCGEGLGVGGIPTANDLQSPPPNLPHKVGGKGEEHEMATVRMAGQPLAQLQPGGKRPGP